MKTAPTSEPITLSDFVSTVLQRIGFDEPGEAPNYVIKHIQQHEQDGHSVGRAVTETKRYLQL